MMLDRRQLIIGGTCVAFSAGAEALRPRRRLSLLGSAQLENIIPKRFDDWKEAPIGAVLQPEQEEGSLSSQLYSQLLGRVYENEKSGDYVMLAIAYGDTQSDLLQLHRPESCYPAFGFTLSSFRQTHVGFSNGASLRTRSMVARSTRRIENVSYWTRIGQFLPLSQGEQRLDKLKTALAGFIPDGILVRCSSIGEDTLKQYDTNRDFFRDLILAIVPKHRAALIGSSLSKSLAEASHS